MWHNLVVLSQGADEVAAPLLIPEVRLRYHWHGVKVEEKLIAKLDTAAAMSAIPLHVALGMGLPSAGLEKDLKSFDHSLELRPYPKFHTEIFIPKWGWMIVEVVGCPRDSILLGRDICKRMLLLVNWRNPGFGMCPARIIHRPLRLLFCRWRRNKA